MFVMRRVLVFVMVMSLAIPVSTVMTAAAPLLAQAAGSISGKASSANGQTLGNAPVRLRNLADGQIAGTTTTNAAGEFSFGALPAGNYSIEVLNAAGEIVGTSATTLAAGANLAGVTVTSTLTTVAATTGSFFASTAGLIAIAGAGAGLAAITVASGRRPDPPAGVPPGPPPGLPPGPPTASPSR
jgi:hypothetical protein